MYYTDKDLYFRLLKKNHIYTLFFILFFYLPFKTQAEVICVLIYFLIKLIILLGMKLCLVGEVNRVPFLFIDIIVLVISVQHDRNENLIVVCVM